MNKKRPSKKDKSDKRVLEMQQLVVDTYAKVFCEILKSTEHLEGRERILIVSRIIMCLFQKHFGLVLDGARKALEEKDA